MERIHGPVVAGAFYPAAPDELSGRIRSLLETAAPGRPRGRLVALIVPHAGLQYSGPVAATAYRLIEGADYRRVVAIGPSHFSLFDGVATLLADGWRTPLGVMPVTPAEHGEVVTLAEPFRREHCLEVQLPFLQLTLSAARLTALLFGQSAPVPASHLVEDLLGEDDLLLVSSDLSHYHPHAEAAHLDRVTADAIVSLDADALGPDSACGRRPIQAALTLARRRGWRVDLLDLRTSGDTAGDRSQVVGYGAFALTSGS